MSPVFRSRASRPPLALALLSLLSGCGGSEAEGPEGVTVRDSAGIVIVESAEAAWEGGGGWTIAGSPTLEIGAVDGPPELQFERIESLLRLGDGRIVVADAGASEIRFYGPEGGYLRSTGRAGDAPGEYRQIADMGTGPGDSLWVYDFGLRRFTVLTLSGEPVRTLSMGGSLSAVGAVGRLSDGSFVVREYWSSGSGTGPIRTGLTREPAAVARLSPDGSQLDTIGLFPGREVFIGSEDGRAVMSAPLFARSSSVALRGDEIVVGTQTTFELGIHTPEGQLKRIVRVPDVDLEISEADVERQVEAELARTPEERRPMTRRHFESLAVPETRPAYGALLVDAAGNVWVAEATRYPTPPRYWTAFDSAGALLGRVDLPAGFALHAAGVDWVLGVWRDELEVERIRLYPLTID